MTSFFLGNWPTRIYFVAVVTAATVTMSATTLGADTSYASIALIALTSPVSIIFAPVFLLGDGWLTVPMMIGSVVAGYLLNTVLINTIVGADARGLRFWRA